MCLMKTVSKKKASAPLLERTSVIITLGVLMCDVIWPYWELALCPITFRNCISIPKKQQGHRTSVKLLVGLGYHHIFWHRPTGRSIVQGGCSRRPQRPATCSPRLLLCYGPHPRLPIWLECSRTMSHNTTLEAREDKTSPVGENSWMRVSVGWLVGFAYWGRSDCGTAHPHW